MKKKILFVSDGITQTSGLANVQRNIIKNIASDYKIASFAMNGKTGPLGKDVRSMIVDEYISYDKNHLPEDMMKAIDEFDPDIVFTIHDFWNLYFMSEKFRNRSFHWLAYFPVDVEPYPKSIIRPPNKISLIDHAKSIDTVIAYNRFGENTLIDAGIRVDGVIHHGVDTDIYYPDEEARNQWRYRLGCSESTFLFTTVGVNMFRKGYDSLLKSWKIFRERHKNSLLYMHTQPYSGYMGWNLPELIDILGVGDSVILPEKGTILSEKEMNALYNGCDCFILTSMGEGFGLPLIEAGACRKPIIYTDYAGPSTVFNGCGLPVQYSADIYYHMMNSRFVIIDKQKCADAMFTMATNDIIRDEYSNNGYKHAQNSTWKAISSQWKELLDKIERREKVTTIKIF